LRTGSGEVSAVHGKWSLRCKKLEWSVFL